MSVDAGEYVAFLVAAAATFAFAVLALAVSLRAQGRGRELPPLLAKLLVSVAAAGVGAYWLGQRNSLSLGWKAFLRLNPADMAILAGFLACAVYAIWVASKALSPAVSKSKPDE